MKNYLHTLYAVQKCKNNESQLYKTKHGSHDGDETVCGIRLNYNWYISNNTFDGEITCKKCLKLLKEQFRERVLSGKFKTLQAKVF